MYEDDDIVEEEKEDFDPTKDPDIADDDDAMKEPDDVETAGWE